MRGGGADARFGEKEEWVIVMWAHMSAEGEMQVSVRPDRRRWERAACAKVREWVRAGVCRQQW
eukprot:1458069-Prymnesium_polylepis.1